jgi:hypothetical protein
MTLKSKIKMYCNYKIRNASYRKYKDRKWNKYQIMLKNLLLYWCFEHMLSFSDLLVGLLCSSNYHMFVCMHSSQYINSQSSWIFLFFINKIIYNIISESTFLFDMVCVFLKSCRWKYNASFLAHPDIWSMCSIS